MDGKSNAVCDLHSCQALMDGLQAKAAAHVRNAIARDTIQFVTSTTIHTKIDAMLNAKASRLIVRENAPAQNVHPYTDCLDSYQVLLACKGPVAQCLVDPCQHAKCEAHPDATCKANYCGGCHAEFYKHGKKVDCSTSPLVSDP